MDTIVAIVGGLALLLVIIGWVLGRTSPANSLNLLQEQAALSQLRWLDFAGQLDDLLSLHCPETEEDGVIIRSGVDFRTMTLESFAAVDDGTHTTVYLLRRNDDGSWEIKEHTTTTEYAGKTPRTQTAIEEVAKFYGVGTAKWQDSLSAEFNRKVAFVQAWHPLDPETRPLIEDRYARVVEFFRQHPGIHPDIKEEDFLAGRFDGQRVWLPPVHS